MTARTPPHDLDAEKAVLGAMLLDNHAIDDAMAAVDASDFYNPVNGTVFDAIAGLYEEGVHVDAMTVHDRLRHSGLLDKVGGTGYLAQIMAVTPSTQGAGRYAEIVARHGHARRLIATLAEGMESAYETDDPVGLGEDVTERVGGLVLASAGLPSDADSMDEWIRADHREPQWAVHGLLRRGHRMVVVAAEGTGKSVMSRQVAMCAAQGVHPFHSRPTPIVNTLIVDLENPGEAIIETAQRIEHELRVLRGDQYREHGCWIWHRPAGIDLRSRRDRAELDALCAHIKPALVVLGPLYRAFTRKGREDHEQVAEEVQRAIDGLRVRHDFAVLVEHHAPKGMLGKRDLVPFGSSLWQRWPDLGRTLERDSDLPTSLRIGHYRGDRVNVQWPERLDRATRFPFEGFWPDGYLREPPDLF